jgi:molecular chaperone DnaK
MPGRLAIDFGTSNTVIAYWDESKKAGNLLDIPDIGHIYQHLDKRISVVPSLIHYGEQRRQWLGGQVRKQNLYDSPRTFRWMKRYIATRSPAKMRVDGREISHFDAGRDFLLSILTLAKTELNIIDEEIALTVPVESYEHYENWLIGIAEQSGMPRFRLIDEPSAAALGYGANIQPGDVYLIFDFGGGTLDVAVVIIEEEDSASQTGRRCRVLGKSGAEIGGMNIDQWMFQEVLKENQREDCDDEVRQVSRTLLVECETAKEQLSFHERADISVINPDTGAILSSEWTRNRFEKLLDSYEVFTSINRTIQYALNKAIEYGYKEEDIKSVLMVGGSSLIPSVQDMLRKRFGRERVMLNNPLDAVALGAAAFVSGVDFYDHIQHNYAIRHVDSKKGGYEYRAIVKQGTPYPSEGTIEKMTVKASYDNQTQLGIAVFEIGDTAKRGSDAPIELIFDPSGSARTVKVTPDEKQKRTYFWMNEETPTFLISDPPARRGEGRFHIEFSLDGNKRLLITARDLKTGKMTHKDYPVVKLA